MRFNLILCNLFTAIHHLLISLYTSTAMRRHGKISLHTSAASSSCSGSVGSFSVVNGGGSDSLLNLDAYFVLLQIVAFSPTTPQGSCHYFGLAESRLGISFVCTSMFDDAAAGFSAKSRRSCWGT